MAATHDTLLPYAPLLGTRFLAYVTASTEAAVERRLSGTPLRGEAEQSFQAALRSAAELLAGPAFLPVVGQAELEPPSLTLARFGRRAEGASSSLANELRRAAGGALPDVRDDGDALLAVLLREARDLFPVTLLPAAPRGFFGLPGLGRAQDFFRFGLGDHEALLRALREPGEPLAQLFPGDLTAGTPARAFWSSAAGGTGMHTVSLSTQVLGSAEERLTIRGESMTAEGFLAAVRDVVGDLRALALGREVEVPVAIGLAGVTLHSGTELSTPWGVLRAADPRIACGMDSVDTATGAMLVGTAPVRLRLAPTGQGSGERAFPPADFFAVGRDLAVREEKARLLLLLAQVSDAPVATFATWRRVSDPTSLASISWSHPFALPAAVPLDASVQAELLRWAALIDANYEPSLDLAVRRTLASALPGREPADALVDAVIALESMFGTGTSEVGFRLSAALAWLLESDPDARLRRHREINEWYGLRSKIVHGETKGRHLDPLNVHLKAQQAACCATDALRTLIGERPELIAAGSERGKRLVLQAFDQAPATELS